MRRLKFDSNFQKTIILAIRNNNIQSVDSLNFASFLNFSTRHKTLVETYWPASLLSPQERNSRTANRVGLNMPKEIDFKDGMQDFYKEALEAKEMADKALQI